MHGLPCVKSAATTAADGSGPPGLLQVFRVYGIGDVLDAILESINRALALWSRPAIELPSRSLWSPRRTTAETWFARSSSGVGSNPPPPSGFSGGKALAPPIWTFGASSGLSPPLYVLLKCKAIAEVTLSAKNQIVIPREAREALQATQASNGGMMRFGGDRGSCGEPARRPSFEDPGCSTGRGGRTDPCVRFDYE